MFEVRRREGLSFDEIFFAVVSLSIHAGAIVFNAIGRTDGLPLGCTFRSFAGFGCPTCGTTRSIMALDRGEVLDAFGFNPLAALAGLFMWAFLVHFVASLPLKKKLSPTAGLRKWTFRLGFFGLLAIWAVRWWLGTIP